MSRKRSNSDVLISLRIPLKIHRALVVIERVLEHKRAQEDPEGKKLTRMELVNAILRKYIEENGQWYQEEYDRLSTRAGGDFTAIILGETTSISPENSLSAPPEALDGNTSPFLGLPYPKGRSARHFAFQKLLAKGAFDPLGGLQNLSRKIQRDRRYVRSKTKQRAEESRAGRRAERRRDRDPEQGDC